MLPIAQRQTNTTGHSRIMDSIEWRRGFDEAIAFCERNAQQEGFGNTWADLLREYADKCVVKHEAEPERKCGTCKYWQRDSGEGSSHSYAMFCSHLDWVATTADWFCADWQRKEGA